jgi:hypothetical protein
MTLFVYCCEKLDLMIMEEERGKIQPLSFQIIEFLRLATLALPK